MQLRLIADRQLAKCCHYFTAEQDLGDWQKIVSPMESFAITPGTVLRVLGAMEYKFC